MKYCQSNPPDGTDIVADLTPAPEVGPVAEKMINNDTIFQYSNCSTSQNCESFMSDNLRKAHIMLRTALGDFDNSDHTHGSDKGDFDFFGTCFCVINDCLCNLTG